MRTSSKSSKIQLFCFHNDDVISDFLKKNSLASRFELHKIVSPDEITKTVPDSKPVFFLTSEGLRTQSRIKQIDRIKKTHPVAVIAIDRIKSKSRTASQKAPQLIDFYLYLPFKKDTFLKTIETGISIIRLKAHSVSLQKKYKLLEKNFKEVNRIGAALSSEHDYDKLLTMILKKCRELSGADAGSLYLVEKDEKEKCLKFKLAQNDTLSLENVLDQALPLNKKSLAGFVAVTGKTLNLKDAYSIPEKAEYSFNRSFDESTGYRTKSMLVIPMKNHLGEITGVLQLINRKKNYKTKLTSALVTGKEVVRFSPDCVEVVSSLASQAAVSIENNLLYKSIETLFEGFVKASVTAIEQRDPTTAGHSERVATLTVRLAEIVNGLDSGPYKDVSFTNEEIKEVRYATLLHDFGKVGVREHVLIKAKKLYPLELDIIRQRFDYIKESLEKEYYKKHFSGAIYEPKLFSEEVRNLQPHEQLKEEITRLEKYFDIISSANEPSVLPEEKAGELSSLVNRSYNIEGRKIPLLSEHEFHFLSVRKGSLTEEERLEIESHVTHTFNFLEKIPWTKDLKKVPSIAYAHHEKLDGSGYPRSIDSSSVPFQSRLITISDIYDALTAADRPYKKAVIEEKALDILLQEAKAKKLDEYLVNLFIEAKVYELVRDYRFKGVI